MAVAKSNSYIVAPSCLCTCYKVSDLRETILNPNKTARLSDRYILREQLGWGQFGVIKECVDRFSGELLACKSISKDRLVTREDIKSIKLEIEIMTELSGHPNVVDLKAVYEEEDYVHLVMELCAGGELFHKLEKHGRFSELEAQVIFRHLMQVVLYCHDKGIVHRDLKPENILLATKSSCSPIKLADFGLATYISPGQSLHGTVGSPFYIAPEVLAGGYNQSADVWSAGVILYILLSGIPPFWGKTKSQIFDAVRASDLRFPSKPWDFISDSAKDLIKGMLCKDASRRLTAHEVLDHSWLTNIPSLLTDVHKGCERNCGLDLSQNRPYSFMSRNLDISFGTGSALVSESKSDSFACKSSFSSFLAAPLMPSLGTFGFSFQSNASSSTHENSIPVISLPSFTFVANGTIRKAVDDSKVSGTRGVAILGIHSRRNHTIGVSEIEHLTESVIRWASCTRLPTATSSLRSSLVC
ncbi:phosphoenolpyruvate carboxylase-related kinase 1 [Striga hermonthica]|uniref:Phosphoenolpyruvate carboxylase-related kinase 1 n=1 Tax=Striga hermonthica TaxID=68872 RepID=A0A9N7NYA2_STRHE|nr:phosphoenolpyruvate carboxylase-related kinase 1 [Striga hermonthica]